MLNVWSQAPGRRRTEPFFSYSDPLRPHKSTQGEWQTGYRSTGSQCFSNEQGVPSEPITQLRGLTTSQEPLQNFAPVRLTHIQKIRSCFGREGSIKKRLLLDLGKETARAVNNKTKVPWYVTRERGTPLFI